MLVYPYLAHYCFTDPQAIGLFLGTSIHDTSQVIGAALTYTQVYGHEEVLKTAAITKLTRNISIAFVIPLLAIMNIKEQEKQLLKQQTSSSNLNKNDANLKISLKNVLKYFPGFVGGFLAAASLRTLGDYMIISNNEFLLMNHEEWNHLSHFIGDELGSCYLLGTAMASVGLCTNIDSLKGVGIKPFIVGKCLLCFFIRWRREKVVELVCVFILHMK